MVVIGLNKNYYDVNYCLNVKIILFSTYMSDFVVKHASNECTMDRITIVGFVSFDCRFTRSAMYIICCTIRLFLITTRKFTIQTHKTDANVSKLPKLTRSGVRTQRLVTKVKRQVKYAYSCNGISTDN